MVQDIGWMIPGSSGSLVARDPNLMVTWKEDSGLQLSPNSTATLPSLCDAHGPRPTPAAAAAEPHQHPELPAAPR